MIAFLYYPYYLVLFWYKDVIGGVFNFLLSFNRYVASLLSVPLLFKTFFKPLKNEYRDGLVFFSIIAGILIKSVLLWISISVLLLMLLVELFVLIFLAMVPLLLVFLIFQKKPF